MSPLEQACRRLREMLFESEHAVFFGGAGVSTDSGLADFRSARGGLYNQPSEYGAPPEEILTEAYMYAHPDKFFDFYRTKLLNLAAPPNSVHYALAQMEAAGIIKCIITQNADNLHQRAGSRHVLDIHGNVYENTCLNCGKHFPPQVVADCDGVPHCDECGGMIRPHIVLFGEIPDMKIIMETVRELNRCDLLLVGGTSLKVSSAPRLLDRFKGKMAIINDEPTPFDERADIVIRSRIAPAFELIWPEGGTKLHAP